MRLRTRLFDEVMVDQDMAALADILGLSPSQVYRVKQGKRRINEKFILGALTAFPEHKFEDLFYIDRDS